MKNSSKKSITQLSISDQAILSKGQLNMIIGGNDGDKPDDYIGIVDIING